jgi:hypothetical protein
MKITLILLKQILEFFLGNLVVLSSLNDCVARVSKGFSKAWNGSENSLGFGKKVES